MSEMQQQRQRRDQQKGECGEQRQPVHTLKLFYIEYLDEGSKNKCPGHKSCKIGVPHHQNSPVYFDLIGIDVPGDLFQEFEHPFHHWVH